MSNSLEHFKHFVFGGVAACVAETATFPIDVAKTRLQLQGQKIKASSQHQQTTPYSGMTNCWRRMATEEGFSVLYRGLSPALLRQGIYGTIKFGLYYTIKESVPGPESLVKNVVIAVVAGSVSSALANPTDVLKVRMQSQNRANLVSQTSVIGCFRDIFVQEGVRGLWRGVAPTAQRAAVVAGVQLPVYDGVKLFFLQHGYLSDGDANHLISSFCAGLSACLASNPIDVVRTRMMNQRKLKTLPDTSEIYKSSWHCAVSSVRAEGPMSLYKGFLPAFTRMGPWNIIFFLVYEQQKQTFNAHKASS